MNAPAKCMLDEWQRSVMRRWMLSEGERVVLVGEDNPHGADPHFALWPAPEGCAGDRLCRVILGLTQKMYLTMFDRVNLCGDRWDNATARRTAEGLLRSGRRLVILGMKNRKAFGFGAPPFTIVHGKVVMLPHPSGRNLVWNEPGKIQLARTVLREAGMI